MKRMKNRKRNEPSRSWYVTEEERGCFDACDLLPCPPIWSFGIVIWILICGKPVIVQRRTIPEWLRKEGCLLVEFGMWSACLFHAYLLEHQPLQQMEREKEKVIRELNWRRIFPLEKVYDRSGLNQPFSEMPLLSSPSLYRISADHSLGLPSIVDEHPSSKDIEQFASSFPIIDLRTTTPLPPLPYISGHLEVHRFELWKLRLLTVFISYLSSILFFRTCQEQKTPFPSQTSSSSFSLHLSILLHHYTINFALFWQVFSLRYFCDMCIPIHTMWLGSWVLSPRFSSRSTWRCFSHSCFFCVENVWENYWAACMRSAIGGYCCWSLLTDAP